MWMKLRAFTLFLTNMGNKQFLLQMLKPILLWCQCCINVSELWRLLWVRINLSRAIYPGLIIASLTLRNMKINRSVKMKIKCTVLLLIPKDTNSIFLCSFTYKAILAIWPYTQSGKPCFIPWFRFRSFSFIDQIKTVSILHTLIWMCVCTGISLHLCVWGRLCVISARSKTWLILWSCRLRRALAVL